MRDRRLIVTAGRALRWLFVAIGLLTFIRFFERSFTSPQVPLDITRTSFDWSVLLPHHPLSSIRPLPTDKPIPLKRIQHFSGKPHHYNIGVEQARCKAVRTVAEKIWGSRNAQHAQSHDQTQLGTNTLDPFAPSTFALIESLDTLWIMGLKKEFSQAVRVVSHLDWSATQHKSCEIMRTTTKMLGGLLSAYDLSKESVLLVKAQELGNMLYLGFDTPTHMPPFWLDFEKARNGNLEVEDNQVASSVTGMTLEFTRLAQLTGESKFYDAVMRVVDHLHDWQNMTKLPGMWPSHFDLKEETFNHDNVFGLGPDSRSAYESLLKMFALVGGVDDRYETMYRNASDVIIRRLLFRPMTPKKLDVLFPSTFRIGDRDQMDSEIQHSTCYVGGMLALGGRLFDNLEHMNLGARLTHGCMWAYNAFAHDVMPESFRMLPCGIDGCKWDEARWRSELEHDYGGREELPMGFVRARDPSYSLRPEAIESVFTLYRITGHEEYREAAWKMFQAIQKVAETPDGYGAVTDVTKSGTLQHRELLDVSLHHRHGGHFTNLQQGHWLGATLKYFYLIFSSPDFISLDEYVFNQEAHPFKMSNSWNQA